MKTIVASVPDSPKGVVEDAINDAINDTMPGFGQTTEIITNGNEGVFAVGKDYANDNGLSYSVFDNDPEAMVERADSAVLVWDGENPTIRDIFEHALAQRLDIHLETVGYEGVFPNELTEDDLMRRFPEIKGIEDLQLRGHLIDAMLDGHPDYVWDIPAASNAYHPADERGDGGQWLHVKRVFYAYDEMARSLDFQGKADSVGINHGKAAALLHDMMKNGLPPYDGGSSHEAHDTLAAEYVRQFTDLPEGVARLCDIHNGKWYNDTQPETHNEQVFHMADMMASRNGVRIGVYEPAEELEGVSDLDFDMGDV